MQLKEEALFTLKFDGKPVLNELGELEKRLNEVKEAQKSVEKGTKEWADNKEAIKSLTAEIKAVREEMGTAGLTVRQLEGYARDLNRELKDLTPGTDAYIKKTAELKDVNSRLMEHRQTIKGVSDEIEKQPSLWERAKTGVAVFFAAFGAMELLQRAFGFVQDGIQKALALSDMMGSVAKATGLSTEQVQELANELDKIDTRTAKESLMDIAQIGGQLGVANDELLGFVTSVDKAAVALGDEFTGGAEQAANELGGLQKLFKETEDLKAGDAINRIGSAINELGADGRATGPVIAEFTARMGQLGDLSPQITETMGLGAAFQELGLSAEISAGGLSNILLTAAKDTATFAQQLGITDAQMKNLINTNPNAFLLQLAASFKGVPADQLATRLADLGIKSQEATKVMALLKDQTELVTQKQDLANQAFTEGTSLTNEFATMNSTAAAEYEKSQKALALIATEVGQGFIPAITKGAQGVVAFVNIIRTVPQFLSDNKTSFAALGLAILALNTNLIAATATSIAHAAAEKARQVWTTSATTAQWLLNAAMTANPIGMVVAAIALLVAGFTAIYNNSATVRGIISGLWEAMKTGVAIISDVTSKLIEWVSKALDPMRPAIDFVRSALSTLWDAFKSGVSFLVSVHNALINFATGGLSAVTTALAPVRSALSSFWSLIDTGITKIRSIGSAIASFLHVDEIVAKTKAAASQIGDAFNKGYGDKLDSERPKQLAAHQQLLNSKKTAEQKGATEMATIVTESDQKAIDQKAVQAEKHRQEQAKRAREAAEKEAAEVVKASAEGLKKVEEMRISAIKDDLQREMAKLTFKRDQELLAITASKASAEVKAVWEKALNKQLVRDIDKAETDHRTKKEKEENETGKRILDLKIKLAGDEKADKLQKLEDVAAAQRLQVQKDVADETQKAALLTQINTKLVTDRETVEREYRRKNQQETQALQDAQYQATVADANNRLALAGTNASQIFDAKKAKLDAEYQYNRQKLEREAAEEKEKNQTLITDADRRAQAEKAIDDRLKSQLSSADQQYEADKTALTAEKNEARRQNHQQYYDAIKNLMQGDFTAFSNFLTQKLAGEKKQLTDSQKANLDKIDKVGEYAKLGIDALTKLSEAYLKKELANIDKEKKTQLAAWKEKYDKGLISKEEFESETDKINKEADRKTKEQQLEAFKRQQKLDILMAVINGAQASLKSLATLGWPLGLIGVAGAVAATAIQIALIKRQQPPSMASGGKIRNAGVPEGPQHGSRYGESGLSITRRDTGEEVAEMEGGEPIMVLSRSTYKNNRPLIDRLLHSSLHRNGAPVYQAGGVMGSDGGTYGGYLRKSGLVRFDDGGYYESDGGGNDSGGGDSPEMDGAMGSSQEVANLTNSQIEKSQAQMEDIEQNTADTVTALDEMNAFLAGPFLTSLKAQGDTVIQEVKNQLTSLVAETQSQTNTLLSELKNQSGMLGVIAAKDLSVSVHNVVQVNNQINVVAGDSNMS